MESVLKPQLAVQWEEVTPFPLDPKQAPVSGDTAPALAGHADFSKVSQIDFEKTAGEFRLQNLIFRAARKLYLQKADSFSGHKQYLAVQLIRIGETFLSSGKLYIQGQWSQDGARQRILRAMSMGRIVAHVIVFVLKQNIRNLELCFDQLIF